MFGVCLFFSLSTGFTTLLSQHLTPLEVEIVTIAEGLKGPVAMDFPKDQSGRVFVCEQTGKIKIIKDGKLLPRPFLDLSSRLASVNKAYSEKGLLGLAFHPEYKKNGRFFVYFSGRTSVEESDHKSILAEYMVSAKPDSANPNSYKVIMEIEQPESNHNGGQLAFGPDGFLYIGLGDGGGGGDKHGDIGNGQNLGTWLGKILRIDINKKTPYSVPPDNPFVGNPRARPEIWAYGLRNPWKFSFDSFTGRLFCADVGQNKWEEINLIEKGKNYGWRIMEGNHCYEPETGCNQANLVRPVAEYGREVGICIIGGFVFQSAKNSLLNGKYVFGDWTGKLFYLDDAGDQWKIQPLPVKEKKDNDTGLSINGFGTDEQGSLYILAQKFMGNLVVNGGIYRIK